VFDTLAPFGAALPRVADHSSLVELSRSAEPVIGNIVMAPVAQKHAIPVRVPVIRRGELLYVLTAMVDAEAFAAILQAEHMPGQWMAAIVDRTGRYVARGPQSVPLVGTLAPQHYAKQLAQSGQSSAFVRTREGVEMYGAFGRSRLAGWVVAVGMPERLLNAGALRAIATLGGGMLAAIAIGFFLALFLGRRISRPIVKLAAATDSLARGERTNVALPPTSSEVEELAAALRQAAIAVRTREKSLREADRMKDEFLASLSHELRNPLAAIVAAGHVLRVARNQPEALTQASDVIERQAAQMSRLVDDLLDVSRVTMGKAHLQREPLNLADHVAGVLDTLSSAGRTRKHRIVRELRPAWVDADPARIEQIAANLIGNALKYTPEGGTVTVRVRREAENSVLEVADTGEGFARELGERLFEVFVQGEQKVDRAQGGLGIGLALVRRLAELHGGSAGAASEGPGRGSVFSVRLPAISPSVQGDKASHPAPVTAPCRPRRILVVEDNEDARRVLLLALTIDGHKVYEAADGRLAIEMAAEVKPEVAVIDIGLPGVDGYEVAKAIRAADYGKRAFLVALTGYGQPADRQRALKAEFDAHLTKPVAPGQIEELLLKLAA
jgi:signal transduction histidine kinase